jgi:acetamidase/formamidase
MSGPILVRGAEVGDTIEVKIRSIELWLPIAAMSTRANRGSIPEDFPYSRDRVVWLDLEKKTIDFLPGIVIPARPFWGDIGVAPPPSMGRIPAGPPGVHGGNMDNLDLQPGTSLFLPVHVPGALLSVSDGHAALAQSRLALADQDDAMNEILASWNVAEPIGAGETVLPFVRRPELASPPRIAHL